MTDGAQLSPEVGPLDPTGTVSGTKQPRSLLTEVPQRPPAAGTWPHKHSATAHWALVCQVSRGTPLSLSRGNNFWKWGQADRLRKFSAQLNYLLFNPALVMSQHSGQPRGLNCESTAVLTLQKGQNLEGLACKMEKTVSFFYCSVCTKLTSVLLHEFLF